MSSVLKLALIFLAAAILALGARFLYVRSLSVQPTPEPEISLRVAVAAADLPAGLLLRDSDLNWKTIPRSDVPRGALTENTPQSELHGALLRHRLEEGTMLKSEDVIRSDAPGFLAATLQPGMRAVSVPVNDVSGNAGLIQPGDYVDMILTQRLGGRASSVGSNLARVVSETVVEHARIIAVGSSFQRDSGVSSASRARTVTIEVPPRTAEAVTVAAELGSLSMVLRSFATTDRESGGEVSASVVAWGDEPQAAPVGPVWGSDVSRVFDDMPAVPDASADETPDSTLRHTPRRITILRGLDKQEQEFSSYAQ